MPPGAKLLAVMTDKACADKYGLSNVISIGLPGPLKAGPPENATVLLLANFPSAENFIAGLNS